MTEREASVAAEIERHLHTGETDPYHAAWPEPGLMARANRAHEDLRGALVREVHRLAQGHAHERPPETDTVALTRKKVEPMVRGLFPRIEQDRVLEVSVTLIPSWVPGPPSLRLIAIWPVGDSR